MDSTQFLVDLALGLFCLVSLAWNVFAYGYARQPYRDREEILRHDRFAIGVFVYAMWMLRVSVLATLCVALTLVVRFWFTIDRVAEGGPWGTSWVPVFSYMLIYGALQLPAVLVYYIADGLREREKEKLGN